jgi:hypothetical protein
MLGSLILRTKPSRQGIVDSIEESACISLLLTPVLYHDHFSCWNRRNDGYAKDAKNDVDADIYSKLAAF